MGKPSVRILVVGDPGVGKSSIINCFISNNFEENLAPVIPAAILPAEATPESSPLTIVDRCEPRLPIYMHGYL